MMKVFICDDQERHLFLIKNIVENLISCKSTPVRLELATTNPEELLLNLTPNDMNLYFLDIDLNNENCNGLDLAIKIRNTDPMGFIVFITSHLGYGMLTFEYKIGAFDYIVKSLDIDVLKNKIDSALNEAIDRCQSTLNNHQMMKNDEKGIKFISDYEEQFVAIDELFTLEVIGNHKLQVITKDRIFECNGTLGGFESKLPNYFFRCHRSIIINLKKVIQRSLKNEFLLLSNGAEIPCSTRKQKKCAQILDELNI